MRIIAGQYRRHPLRALVGMDTRPTSDRLRETLFDILTAGRPDGLEGTRWLDAFAGTGAVGLEALSRGARMVYFVENARPAVHVIQDNLRALKVVEGFQVLERDIMAALRQLEASGRTCDYCYLDPPYRCSDLYTKTLEHLGRSALVAQGGVVCVEHHKQFDPGGTFGFLQRYRCLQQGDAALSFYRRDMVPQSEVATLASK